jgi:hypothetical protein
MAAIRPTFMIFSSRQCEMGKSPFAAYTTSRFEDSAYATGTAIEYQQFSKK